MSWLLRPVGRRIEIHDRLRGDRRNLRTQVDPADRLAARVTACERLPIDRFEPGAILLVNDVLDVLEGGRIEAVEDPL